VDARRAGAVRGLVGELLFVAFKDAGPRGGNAGRVERLGEVRLLIRGIARGVASTEVAELFAPFGADPERIALPRDRRTRRRKGIAYVMVPNAKLAAAAIQALNNTVLQEKTITIETAAERPPKRPRRFNGPPRRF
jgi:RNA recognition motif-containing protein